MSVEDEWRITVEGRPAAVPVVKVSAAEFNRDPERHHQRTRFARVVVLGDNGLVHLVLERQGEPLGLGDEGMIDPLAWARYVHGKQR